MATSPRSVPDDEYELLLASWLRHLEAEGKPKTTLKTYAEGVNLLARYLRDQDPPPDPSEIVKDHIVDWLIWMDKDLGHAASSRANRYRSVQQWFNWMVDEEEIAEHPMARMKPPAIPEKVVEVVPEDALKRLLDTCKVSRPQPGAKRLRFDWARFIQIRDEAIIRVFMETGPRVSEVAGQLRAEVDWDQRVIWVLGKGSKRRASPFNKKTAAALDKYLRMRDRHPDYADLPNLWIAQKGAMTDWGIRQMVERRCVLAEIPHIHPHKLRHTVATAYMDAGGQSGDLQRLMGWESEQMVKRYSKTTADKRAREAHRKMALADRL